MKHSNIVETMDHQHLQTFLSSIDNYVAYAIYANDGDSVVVENNGNSNYSFAFFKPLNNALKRTIICEASIFKICAAEELFQCVKTGNTGYVGTNESGKILVAQKSSSASVIFIGEANSYRSYLCNVTRALRFHEHLNNANIDNMEQINTGYSSRNNILKG